MEIIKNFKDLPYQLPFDHQPVDSQDPEAFDEEDGAGNLSEEEQDRRLLLFNSGQVHLAEEVLFAIEQIQISISLNDGNFCTLIDELHENLRQFLAASHRPQDQETLS